MNRRNFLHSSLLTGGALAWQSLLPAWAQGNGLATLAGVPGLQGNEFDLTVAGERSLISGKNARHIRLNGHFPAPLLRWREGDALTLRVHNMLDEPTSIHWHGLLLPAKTPRELVTALRNAAVGVLNQPAVAQRLVDLGYVTYGTQPEEFAAYLKAEIAKLGRILRGLKVTVD